MDGKDASRRTGEKRVKRPHDSCNQEGDMANSNASVAVASGIASLSDDPGRVARARIAFVRVSTTLLRLGSSYAS